MFISVIIPCFNEVATLEIILDKVLAQKKIVKEIILIDDGSTDGTTSLIKKKLKKKIDIVIHHKRNKGKGAAIKSGLKKAKGEIILIQDADLEYNPKDYYKLIRPILKKKTLVVYGSRVLNKIRYQQTNFISWDRVFFNHALTIISNLINKQKLTDAHTCYKTFHKSILKRIRLVEDDFSFCPEITTKISLHNFKILEVPIEYNGRSYASGKKISFYDGLKAIYVLLKYRYF